MGTHIDVVQSADMAWIALAPGAWYKPLRFNADDSGWVSLVRLAPGSCVPRHRHSGPVTGFVLQGSGRFVEADVTVRCGSFSHEPTDTVDTLRCEGDVDLVVLFSVEGQLEFLAADGAVLRVESATTKQQHYARHAVALSARTERGTE